jgi:hypothetical protein
MTKVHKQEIDAVALVREIRDTQAAQIQGMTTEQQIAFYQAKAQDLLHKIQSRQLARRAKSMEQASVTHESGY